MSGTEKKNNKRKVSSLAPQQKGSSLSVSTNHLSKKGTGDVVSLEKIQDLKKSVLASKSNLNDLLALFEYTESKKIEVLYASMKAIQSTLITFIRRGDIQLYKTTQSSELDQENQQISEWLGTILSKWYQKLLSFFENPDSAIQVAALDALFYLLKEDSKVGYEVRNCYTFNTSYMDRIAEALVDSSKLCLETSTYLVEKYLNHYHDARFFFLKSLSAILNKTSENLKNKESNGLNITRLTEWVFKLLNGIRSMPSNNEDLTEFWAVHPGSIVCEEKVDKKQSHYLLTTSAHYRQFQQAWLALFRFPLSSTLLKQILLALHQRILPYFLNPVALLDFLSTSYDNGGVIALLALNGLFTLIQKHNMDYPDFYSKLYVQFTPDLLHVKYRSRFFRLVEVFLNSTHISANLIAAFIKRMARIALHGPPGGIVIILPFIYNLLRAHPTCMCLIHKIENTTCGKDDPYAFEQNDPLASNAMESSLWEVETLMKHYSSNVSALAKLFSDKFIKTSYQLEDFMDHNFISMIGVELGKPFKKVPALSICPPLSLIHDANIDSSNQKEFSLCSEWSF